MNKPKIKFCISSHKAFYETTYPIIVRSLLNSHIPSEDIYFFIGGNNEYKQIPNNEGVNLYEVDHNSFDFTALISVVELDLKSDYWFLLHDTCLVETYFYEKVMEYDYTDKEGVSLLFNLSMNIGAYSWKLLQDHKEILISKFKNTDFSESSLQKYKKQAVICEDYFLKPYSKNFYNDISRVIKHTTTMYKTGTERIHEWYPDIGLQKWKANHKWTEGDWQLKL